MPDGTDGFSPWSNMAPQAPAPSPAGTKRDFANMSNEVVKIKKPRSPSTHWELPHNMKSLGLK